MGRLTSLNSNGDGIEKTPHSECARERETVHRGSSWDGCPADIPGHLLRKAPDTFDFLRHVTIDTDMKAKRDKYYFRINYPQNYESESERKFGGGGVDEIHLKLAVMPKKSSELIRFKKAKAKAKKYVGGINFTLISASTV